jgi:hypothetical protein
MKLNLTEAQIKKALKGMPVQVKYAQMGSGMNFNFHPSNLKKLAKAHRLGKGVRISLTGGELGDMEGGNMFKSISRTVNKGAKSVGRSIKNEANKTINRGLHDIEKGATKYINKADREARKYVNKGINEVEKNAKKYVTEKNIGKYALKGYNALNNQLEKQGLSSIHGAILNEGLGAIPFVPQSAKDVAAHYAEKKIDRALSKESAKYGAGMRGRGLRMTPAYATAWHRGGSVNPYLPTGMLGSGVKEITTSGKKVFSDQHNVLRKGQSGFKGLSAQQSELLTGGNFNLSTGGNFNMRTQYIR